MCVGRDQEEASAYRDVYTTVIIYSVSAFNREGSVSRGLTMNNSSSLNEV